MRVGGAFVILEPRAASLAVREHVAALPLYAVVDNHGWIVSHEPGAEREADHRADRYAGPEDL
jgi:hypothetical protein